MFPRKKKQLMWYSILFICIIELDRITKYFALRHLADKSIKLHDFLSFDLVFNRGISGGLLHTGSDLAFILLTCFISVIVMILFVYTYYRWRENKSVIGEVMVIAGALSNIIDRIMYKAVVDFIHVSYGSYSFPIFNIADACIVIGVGIMFYMHMREK
jgi:signal peptidase II